MTDDIKELLTLAAKACGRSVKFTDSPKGGCYLLDGGEAAGWWAPHLDDGDGARMEAELTISVEWHSYDVAASSICPGPSIRTKEEYADHNNDRQAARRWASLRAAAAIGGGGHALKLIHIQRNVMSGQCKGALLRIQVRYTAIFVCAGLIRGWAGSHLGIFTPRKTKDGYKCTGFYFRPWLAPDVAVSQLPKWYLRIARSLSFSFE